MKKALKNILSLLLILTAIISCQSENKKSSTTKAFEQLMKSQSGESVELPDDYTLENSQAKVNYTADGVSFFDKNESLTCNVIAKQNNNFLEIHFQIFGEEGKAVQINIQKVPLDFKVPLKIPFAHLHLTEDDKMQAILTGMNLASSEGSLGFGIPFEGHLTIKKMNQKNIMFEAIGKGGDYMAAENPESWKVIKLNAELINPMITVLGIEKSKIFK